MKLKTLCSYFLYTIAAGALIISLNACNKDDDNNNPSSTTAFSATLDQSQETPPTGEAGTGTCTATYDKTSNLLTYTITWTGLTGAPTAMHFHKADVGVAGDVEIPITGFSATTNGTLSGSATVDEDEEEDLFENKFYVNIHTTLHPAGEIRGQLIQQ